MALTIGNAIVLPLILDAAYILLLAPLLFQLVYP